MPIARKWARAPARSGASESCVRARRRSSAGSGRSCIATGWRRYLLQV